MKFKLKMGLFILIMTTTGCSDRAEKFLDGYAEIETIELDSDDYAPKNNYEYVSGHSYKNTNDAIIGQLATLKSENENTKAIANVFKASTDKINQCIIVHRPHMTQAILTHELGHCFNLIYFEKLEEKAPVLLEIIKNKREGYRFLIESFAEIAASTVAFDIDGDNSYLKNRIQELKGTAYSEEMEPYLRSLPLMESLSEFLDQIDLPSTPEEQVRFILDEFYLNPEFNKTLQRTSR